ncbi:outer dense fiber protein 3-like [Argonauta hians]
MEFTPTVPRGPIIASFTGPGPCYRLPNLLGEQGHDAQSTYHKAPSFGFGIKLNRQIYNKGPGPKYNHNNSRVNRTGKYGTPEYSMSGRPKQNYATATPGPGTYSLNGNTSNVYKCSPTFSFGMRHKSRLSENTPAPNTYQLPSLLGKTIEGGKSQAPAFTLLGRKPHHAIQEAWGKSPGPCAYDTVKFGFYGRNAPEYSMHDKCRKEKHTTDAPGPGAHNPEKTWAHKIAPPCYSFGIRHSPFKVPMMSTMID